MAKKEKKVKTEDKPVEDASGGVQVLTSAMARKSLKKKKSKKAKRVSKEVSPKPEQNAVSAPTEEATEKKRGLQQPSNSSFEDEKKEERSQPSVPPSVPRSEEVPLDISVGDEDEILSDPPARVARLKSDYEHMSAQQMMEDARQRLAKMDDMEYDMLRMKQKLQTVQMTQEMDLEKQNVRRRKQTTDMTPPPPPVTIIGMGRRGGSDEATDMKQYDDRKRADYDSDDEDHYEVRTFPRNTFSFLLLAKYPLCDRGQSQMQVPWAVWKLSDIERRRWQRSRDYLCLPFWFAWSILILQIGIYTLALYNAVDFNDSQNPFQFPINVDSFTRTAELLAVLITVYTQNNIFQGVDLFVQSFNHIGQTPGVTIWKYYIAAVTQALVGLYGVFVTFIIIMQSQEVVDLLLNFTAMEFVAALDDAAFELSFRGFLGFPMKKTAKIVRDVRYHPRDKCNSLRKWPLFIVLVAVMGWSIMVQLNQHFRRYGDNVIYVQLKDNAIPWLTTLSGTYIGCTMKVKDHSELTEDLDDSIGLIFFSKLSEDDCRDNWKTTDGIFFFCGGERWVFAVGQDKFDPCNKWSIRSFKADALNTDAYDILAHATTEWFAKDTQSISSSGVLESIQFLVDFDPNAIDVGCRALSPTGSVFAAPMYERVEDVKIRDRPVYYGPTAEGGEFIIYNGGRWLTLKKGAMPDCAANCTIPDTVKCIPTCLQKFDPYQSNYTVLWISDPMDLRTNSDTWIPTTALNWNKASSDGNGNAATPVIDAKSFLEKYNEWPQIVREAESREATEEQIDNAKSLFLQSAKLSCACKDDGTGCEAILRCSNGGTRVWVDVKTDPYPEETCVAIKTKEASDAEFFPACETTPAIEESGAYDWGIAAINNLTNAAVYSYRSCLPPGECGLVYWQDSFGDGMSSPGSVNVAVDGLTLQNGYDNNRTLFGPLSCVYQFGDTCENSVKCYIDHTIPTDDLFLDADDDYALLVMDQPEGIQQVYSSV
eukprot:CAMPEP_0113601178 /NCGR_PEP_ID=MMETSP0017_2-20120614/92_1 /TAXON_ID=2856 /ORGANISM="Cylindrotheca closterium" /LENGTH=988 /DNA_ID=CAMNT_0000509457 /DNA_START=15 /DNA_END=2981 /DNA_ORIENTATION=+ /assembly_acc=CAM_ASM_000147